MNKSIGIIGGDLRIIKLAEMIEKDGYSVYTYGIEKMENADLKKCDTLEQVIKNSDIIMGPVPLSSKGTNINSPFSDETISLEQLQDSISNKVFIAGNIKPNVYEALQEKNNIVIDILKREELAVLNAISTAEGAIQVAMEETSQTIHGSNVLILGFGRIGKILAKMLDGMGAKVACEARKNSDLAWIKAYGYEPIPIANLKENLNRFDVIINTIPYIILDKDNLENVRKDVLLIDLASNPGGVDKDAIKEKKIKFIWALSLAGKVAPVTSAEFIKETLYNIFSELKGE